jgi:hypothetical protein
MLGQKGFRALDTYWFKFSHSGSIAPKIGMICLQTRIPESYIARGHLKFRGEKDRSLVV